MSKREKQKKITQTTLSEYLNISRTTVSKVFNGLPVSEETYNTVLNAAVKLNYLHPLVNEFKSKSEGSSETDIQNNIISVFCPEEAFEGAFWPPILKGVENVLRKHNLLLRLVIIDVLKQETFFLPTDIHSSSGIIILGNFTSSYCKFIYDLKIPLVTLDISRELYEQELLWDVVAMENQFSIYNITTRLIKEGCSNIAFVGTYNNCQSLYERYLGYIYALFDNGMDVKKELIYPLELPLETPDIFSYYSSLDIKPTVFVCENDFLAKKVYRIANDKYNYCKDIRVTGFDYDKLHTNAIPHMMTVDVFPETLGETLGNQIVWRINNPTKTPRYIKLPVKIVTK